MRIRELCSTLGFSRLTCENEMMITSARMAAVDRNAEALGISPQQLMESGGNAVAQTVRSLVDIDSESQATPVVAIVAGRGNNGGDGFVAARFLDEYTVSVSLLGRPETIRTATAKQNWEAVTTSGYDTTVVRDASAIEIAGPDGEQPDLIVDAMLGTGVTGALREPEATAARQVNNTDAPVLSVDVPSGVDADTGSSTDVSVDADHVVTFHDQKPGLETIDADVTVADIGIPRAAEQIAGPGDLQLLSRPTQSHKGDFGEVLVVGGGPYTGAPALTAQAALRAGADLVRVACPVAIADEIQNCEESLIIKSYPGERLTPTALDHVQSLAANHDVTVLGPGLGDDEKTLSVVASFLRAHTGKVVVDADALSVVPSVDPTGEIICTPHQGELAAMGGETADDWERRVEKIAAFISELDETHTLLVKGAIDIISNGETTRINQTGNPGMTVGGTGDVLAGAVGALACVLDPIQAATVGAYANGRAGDIVVEKRGNGLLATDLLDILPTALQDPKDMTTKASSND